MVFRVTLGKQEEVELSSRSSRKHGWHRVGHRSRRGLAGREKELARFWNALIDGLQILTRSRRWLRKKGGREDHVRDIQKVTREADAKGEQCDRTRRPATIRMDGTQVLQSSA